MKDIIDKFLEVFDGYKFAYGQHSNLVKSSSGKVNGRAQTIKNTYSNLIVEKHLNGKGASFGIVPLKKNNKVKFAAIDIDIKHPTNPIKAGTILEIAAKVDKMGLPLIACQSKSKGVHLYCFTQEEVSSKLLISRMREWASMLGFGSHEIFPKQERRRDKDEIGNWINLPYFNHKDTVRYAVNKGKRLEIEEFFKLVEVMRISTKELNNFELPDKDESYDDAPPCLQTIISVGVEDGSRNNGLYDFAVFFKKKYPDTWQDKVSDLNYKIFSPRLKKSEVEGIIKSINKKDFFYKCNEYPICQYCNKTECRKRKYGIGRQDNKTSDKFTFDNLKKHYSSENSVIWIAEYQGKRVKLTTQELVNPRLARVAILNQCNIVVKNIPQEVWLNRIEKLMDTCLVIEDPRGASRKGQFEELFDNFLTTGGKSKERKSLLKGNTYLDIKEDKIYFRSTDLFEYLKNHRFKFEHQDIWLWLKDMGAGKKQVSIRNKRIRAWFIKIPEFYDEENDMETKI